MSRPNLRPEREKGWQLLVGYISQTARSTQLFEYKALPTKNEINNQAQLVQDFSQLSDKDGKRKQNAATSDQTLRKETIAESR